MDSELARLMLQLGGVVVTTVAIGLLVPFATDPEDEAPTRGGRPDRVVR